MVVAFGYCTTIDGITFYPLSTLAPINVGADGNAETVTPASVTGKGLPGYDQVSFTADFANAHGKGDIISSATFGLQEALNLAGAAGGGEGHHRRAVGQTRRYDRDQERGHAAQRCDHHRQQVRCLQSQRSEQEAMAMCRCTTPVSHPEQGEPGPAQLVPFKISNAAFTSRAIRKSRKGAEALKRSSRPRLVR